ncbi:thioredoxin domain-containing protein [Pseudonocardia nematodicida]|uniref:Thioredoxin domain-containing protein n=1 Tax=Pseudonocardia nematodicida TaxID=1206997 RepID=A0ABV1K3K3_9PSEU
MTCNTRLSLIVAGVFVVVVGVVFAVTRLSADPAPSGADEAAAVAARPDSLTLPTAPGSTVTFVEFLDFECEACGAVYPAIEQLRGDYGDRVNFVIRHFPGAGHNNAEPASRAVEAAARQDRLEEEMYSLMFETQAEWGEQRTPMDDRFRGYAEQLGLDMARYDADYADPAVAQRIQDDRADGLALGARGTPTFFVDGELVEPRTYEDLTGALDAALAGS